MAPDNQDNTPARLAPMLIDSWRELNKAWAEARAYSELLQAALVMIRERDTELARLHERYYALFDERRHHREKAAA
jgi:hypothetical protein